MNDTNFLYRTHPLSGMIHLPAEYSIKTVAHTSGTQYPRKDEQDDKQKRRAYFAEPHGAVQHFTSFQKIKSHDPHVSVHKT